jgi:hypothetical protein
VNTSFEVLEKMTGKVATLESEILELKKTAAGALKAANMASNTADGFKKLGKMLAK